MIYMRYSPLRYVDGCDPPGLGAYDLYFIVVGVLGLLQYELGHLGGLAAAGVPRYDQDSVFVEFVQY